jgi:hypothetical protein
MISPALKLRIGAPARASKDTEINGRIGHNAPICEILRSAEGMKIWCYDFMTSDLVEPGSRPPQRINKRILLLQG